MASQAGHVSKANVTLSRVLAHNVSARRWCRAGRWEDTDVGTPLPEIEETFAENLLSSYALLNIATLFFVFYALFLIFSRVFVLGNHRHLPPDGPEILSGARVRKLCLSS